jgi:hypothetical protein
MEDEAGTKEGDEKVTMKRQQGHPQTILYEASCCFKALLAYHTSQRLSALLHYILVMISNEQKNLILVVRGWIAYI